MDVVRLFIEHGADKEKGDRQSNQPPLCIACYYGRLPVVQLLLETGAGIERACCEGWTPLIMACMNGSLEVARYLLEQGADRDKADSHGYTPLHHATLSSYLEVAKLLMVYGADLNARTNDGRLPIDIGGRNTEEIRQAIRDEPRRRMDEAPGKRATEQDRHPNAATAASAQQENEEDEEAGVEPSSKKPCLDEGVTKEDEVAEENEDSEPSDGEDD